MSRRRTRRRRAAEAAPAAKAAPAAEASRARRDTLERGLRTALFAALALVLLTPFVVTPETVFPFAVGKALWSRASIEVAFALWAVLALARPGYRPPRSWLLLALAAGLGAALVSGWAGASPERSLWSDYERMQGWIDRAHWFALAVVLVSVLRGARDWRALLGASAASGAAMACLVIARAAGAELPWFWGLAEHHLPRFGGPWGNPVILGVHLLANLVLAAGLAVRAWAGAGETQGAARRRRRAAALGWTTTWSSRRRPCTCGSALSASVHSPAMSVRHDGNCRSPLTTTTCRRGASPAACPSSTKRGTAPRSGWERAAWCSPTTAPSR